MALTTHRLDEGQVGVLHPTVVRRLHLRDVRVPRRVRYE